MSFNDNIDKTILDYLDKNPLISSKQVHEGIDRDIGYATLKRVLKRLHDSNYVDVQGRGRGTKYSISQSYQILHPIDIEDYFEVELDQREILQEFNLELIPEILSKIDLFTTEELFKLQELQDRYAENTESLSKAQYNQELERLAIDLSWKSSQIEGNTYSLLETERLLKEQKTADGKSRDEATMLLNHKEALYFIVDQPDYLDPIGIRAIEDIHSILMKDLRVDRNIRTRRVRISGTNYNPLDNEFQIREALQLMCIMINKKDDIFEKSLLLLILLSYIQAFNDGNKRTARIVSNSMLINNKYCPLSYRTVDSLEYKKAMLLFYEQNNISGMKRIFIDQFEFAVNTYF